MLFFSTRTCKPGPKPESPARNTKKLKPEPGPNYLSGSKTKPKPGLNVKPGPGFSGRAAHARVYPPPPPPRQPQPKKLPLNKKQSTRLPLPRRNLHPLLPPPAPAPTQKEARICACTTVPPFSLLPNLPGARPASDPSPSAAVSESNQASPVPPIHCPTTNGRRGGSFRCSFSGVITPGPGPGHLSHLPALLRRQGSPPTPTRLSNGTGLSVAGGRAHRSCRLAGAGPLVLPRLSLPASSWGGPNLQSGRYSSLACVWGFAGCFPTVQGFAKFWVTKDSW